jgi:hypothetical protein
VAVSLGSVDPHYSYIYLAGSCGPAVTVIIGRTRDYVVAKDLSSVSCVCVTLQVEK